MMGEQDFETKLYYQLSLDRLIPQDHLLRRIAEAVGHLLLWCTFARARDYETSREVSSIRGLLDTWEIYTETGAHSFIGWSTGTAPHEVAVLMREASTPEIAKEFFSILSEVDLLEEISELRVPTLVLHPRALKLVDVSLARQLVSTIPQAKLLIVDGDSMSPSRCELDVISAAIDEFLAETFVRADSPRDRIKTSPEVPARLSRQENKILQRLASGLSNREIAEDLVLSTRTVESHVANIYQKTSVANRSQATAYAIRHNLV